MSATTTHTTETTERKPPTIADIVREKTGDGALIIDFFTDVMTGRIEGAELCHRIDAAKQLVKYGSKDAAEFIAKYKGVPCGHSTGGRPNPADPCSAEERSLVAVTLNAPATLTRDFLAVLSGIDEFLMARLIRAQTADGVTIIEFLDDVMQDRTDGFKTHHRIAAAKELIVHIIRDEQPSHTPSPSTGEGWGEGDSPVVGTDPRVRPLPGSHTPAPSTGEGGARPESPPRSEGDSPVVPAQTEGNPDNSTVIPAKAGIQEGGVARPSKAGVHPEPNSPVVPAEAGTHGSGGGRSTAANPARTEPSSTVVPADAGTQGGGGVRNTAANPARTEPNSTVVPAEAGTQGSGGGRNTAANPARTEPSSTVVPADAGTQGGGGGRNTPANSAHPEPNTTVVPAEAGTQGVGGGRSTAANPARTEPNSPVVPAEAGTQGGGGGRSTAANPVRAEPVLSTAEGSVHPEPVEGSVPTKEPAQGPALPSLPQLTTNNQQLETLPALPLEQHWHEPDPYGAPIDSTTPGRSPP